MKALLVMVSFGVIVGVAAKRRCTKSEKEIAVEREVALEKELAVERAITHACKLAAMHA